MNDYGWQVSQGKIKQDQHSLKDFQLKRAHFFAAKPEVNGNSDLSTEIEEDVKEGFGKKVDKNIQIES